MTHKDLVHLSHRWVLKNTFCGVAFKDLYSYSTNGERPDVIGFGGWGKSVLIEVKITKNDFYKDRNKKFRIEPETGMGTFRFYCCPENVIRVEDLPQNWGLIYEIKGKLKCVHNPYNEKFSNIWKNGFVKNTLAEHATMYSALRRLNLKGHIEAIYEQDRESS